MRPQIRSVLITVTALTIMLVACTNSPVGIFESIEREREILDDRNLDNELRVGAIALAGDKYFIAAGSLLYRGRTDADYVGGDREQWHTLPAPGSASDNYSSTSLVAFDPDGAGGTPEQIYAVYRSQTGTESGLYHVNPVTLGVGTTPLIGSEDAGIESVEGVFVVDDGSGSDVLIVPVRTGLSAYSVYYSADATVFAEIPGLATNQPITSVAADGTDVLFLTPSVLYRDGDTVSAGADPAEVATLEPESGASFGDAYYQASSFVWWVSDGEGHLFSTLDFVDWTTNDTPYEISTSNDDPLPFTVFVEVSDTVDDHLLVGTEGHGYRILGADASVAPVSPAEDGSNYEASELADAAILTWFVDPTPLSEYPVPTEPGSDPYTIHDGYMLFAGTSGAGLWHALSYDGSIQWLRE